MSKRMMQSVLANIARSKSVGLKAAMIVEQRRFLARSLLCMANSANSISVKDGLLKFRLAFPGDKDACQFSLKPAIDRVGDLAKAINAENPSRFAQIRVASSDNVQYAKATPIEALVRDAFSVTIRDAQGELVANLQFDKPDNASLPVMAEMNEQLRLGAANLTNVQSVVDRLYKVLHFDEIRSNRKTVIETRLQDLGKELATLEQQRDQINVKALQRARMFSWVGLGYMGIQCGLLARLTWWEYSWDIVEPCTYFVGYATLMVYFAYYLLTRQEWTFPAAEDRQYAMYFHALADKRKFDMARYVELRKQADALRSDLQALGFEESTSTNSKS